MLGSRYQAQRRAKRVRCNAVLDGVPYAALGAAEPWRRCCPTRDDAGTGYTPSVSADLAAKRH